MNWCPWEMQQMGKQTDAQNVIAPLFILELSCHSEMVYGKR